MDKKDLVEAIKSQFAGLVEMEGPDFDMSAEAAVYYFANHWHSGQWSDLYRILCECEYKPGRLESFDSWREEDPVGEMFYDFLVGKYEGKYQEEVANHG